MEILETIQKRRSIRNFKEEDISDDVVMKILDTARLAPSAKNRQPWYFIVARGNLKNKIAELMEEYTQCHDMSLHEKEIKFKSSVNPTARVVRQAPILILVFKPKDENWTIGDCLSVGACVENICLSALEFNLGTLWIRDTVYVHSEVEKLLNMEDMEFNCSVALGVPNEEPVQRPRKDLKDIVKFME